MGTEQSDSTGNLPANISSAIEKMPEGWRTKAIKTALRIVGGSEAVAAYVAGAQERWDTISANSFITQEMAKVVVDKMRSDPAQVDRYMRRFLGDGLQRQARLENIAVLAIEDLRDDPPSEDPEREISEEFLNKFPRYAEDITGEDAQKLWGRVLAGEMRSPGRFSLRTLRFLSELDKDVAEAFEGVAQNSLAGNAVYVPPGTWNSGPEYLRLKLLVEAGLLADAPGQSHRPVSGMPNGNHFVWQERTGLILKSSGPCDFKIPICLMTSVGKEVFKLLKPIDELKILESIAANVRYEMVNQPFLAFVGHRVEIEGGAMVAPTKVLWGDLATFHNPPN